MSDVSKFKVLNKTVNVKDASGRNQSLQYYNNSMSAINLINRKLINIINVVTDFGADNTANTDSTEALKKAFDVTDAFIYFPKGNYLISDSIRIKSNTYVFGYRALLQNKDSNNFFINDSDGTTGGFNANSNITINGLWFRGLNMTQTIVAFGHCSDIHICNCQFACNSATNEEQNWHLLEINSCRRVLIENCLFSGSATFKTEMLQLDVATSSSVFPWFGPYDNTPCTEIEISNCQFRHPDKYAYDTLVVKDAGIGNHNGNDTASITKVNIHGCHFTNVKIPFKFQYLANSIITDNIVYECQSGFAYLTSQIIKNVKITNNEFRGNRSDFTEKFTSTTMGRGISISNVNGQLCQNNIISGNTVDGFATHGIAVNGNYSDISGNIIRACGHTGLYTDYDAYMCNFHDNISTSNAVLDPDGSFDLLVSHTKTSNVSAMGRNDIYNNKCGTMRCAMFTTDTEKSRVFNNVYNSILYPTTANLLNVYGNTQYLGNPNYVEFTNTLSESSTSSGSWHDVIQFTADHTCYMCITFQTTITDSFTGGFHARILAGSDNVLARQTVECSKGMTNIGCNITITAKVLKDQNIKGGLYFVYGGGVSGNCSITAIEIPVPLENTDS